MKSNYFLCSAVLAATLFSGVAYADATGSKSVSEGGGIAEATVKVYTNGTVVFETHAQSKRRTSGVKADVFAVGVDKNGNAIYVSSIVRIPTACGQMDTCKSNVRGTSQASTDASVAANVTSVDIYIGSRGSLGPTWEGTINKAKAACDALHLNCSLG